MPIDEDPCARAERLRLLREELITGQAVTETQFGEDAVRFSKADLPSLDREIRAAEAACTLAQGGTPKRRRFAMGAQFRPY